MKGGSVPYIIQTLSQALDLLELFQEDNAELGILDLSQRLKLHKNSVVRLASTLEAKDYLEKDSSTGTYRLGIKSRVLGLVATRQIDFAIQARPFLDNIKQRCHETCYFSVIKGGCTYYLDGLESDLPVRMVQRFGHSRPLYCTASGRVQLAFLEPQKQIDLLSCFEIVGLTAATITDPDELFNELNKVAQNGYAIEDQEFEVGIMEIAAPVFDSTGSIFGALSIVGPAMRFAATRLENELLPLLCQNASRFSRAFGRLPVHDGHQYKSPANRIGKEITTAE